MTADPFRFVHPLRVRWAECDTQGVVFNPHYMMYCDVGFTEWMRAAGLEYPASLAGLGTDLFMVAAQLNFRAPARYDDELGLAVRCASLGRTSFTMQAAIRRGRSTLAEAALTYVHVSLPERTPSPLPEMLTGSILAFETTPPERKLGGQTPRAADQAT